MLFFFFFQAEDGIRDLTVTGVQTCALPIFTLEEFERSLAGIHTGTADNTRRSLPHPSQLLERLINAKLILQEARNIGIDELPEGQRAEKAFEEETLRGMLYGYHVR